MTRKLFDGPYSRAEVTTRLTGLYRDSLTTDGSSFITAIVDLACDSHDLQRLSKKIATGNLLLLSSVLIIGPKEKNLLTFVFRNCRVHNSCVTPDKKYVRDGLSSKSTCCQFDHA